MTLVEIVNKLKKYAEGQFNNPTVMVGSVYENMNTKELRYPCINFDNANVIKRENDVVYSFYVYYADRLNEDASNQLEIQSQAMNSLQLILHNIYDSGAITLDEFYNAIITPFKLKFVDVCAGAWMQINVHAIAGIGCDTGIIPPEPIVRNYFYTQISKNDSIYLHNYNENLDLEYSLNGREWINIGGGATTSIAVQSGDTVYWRGDNPNGVAINDRKFLRFDVPKNTKLGGDILSLLSKDFSITRIPDWGFFRLFSWASVSEIDNIFKNVTHFGSNACEGMFSYNNDNDLSLTTAPEIPANATFSSGCFNYMFQRRRGLNYVKCLSTAISGDTYTKNWLDNVSGEGIFEKNINAEGWLIDSEDGIPLGWTVRNVDPQPVDPQWQSGYTSGYTDGYTDGYSEGYEEGEESVPLSSTSITENGTFYPSDGGWNEVEVNVSGGSNVIEISKEEYDALVSAGTLDETALYVISGYTDNYELGYASGWTDGYNESSEGAYQSGYTSGYTDGFQSGHTSGYTAGYESGETHGEEVGYQSGFTDGVASGYSSGSTDGFEKGFDNGFTSGYTSGYTDGYSEGYQSGKTDGAEIGYEQGFQSGWTSGYTSGHTDGYAEGQASVPLSSTAFTANDTYTKAEGGWNEVIVNVPSITTQTLTQAQYDALAVKDPMVIYLING